MSEPSPVRAAANEFQRRILLLDIQSTGFQAKRGRGEPPSGDAKAELRVDLKTGFVREAEDRLAVVATFKVAATTKKDDPKAIFAHFMYRVFARYHAPGGLPSDDILDEFVNTNGLIHLWPYFRAWLQNTSMQLGLTPVVLPPFRVGQSLLKPSSSAAHASPSEEGAESNAS